MTDRLWNALVKQPDGCWIWPKSVDTRGYGHMMLNGKVTRVHRLAYELTHGAIGSTRMLVMHSCDVKRCCNPDHLSLGTHADNMADMAAKGRADRHARERNGRAVLTEAQVDAIRSDPRGTRTIAAEYPVSRSAIQRIKTGRAWAV